VSQRLRGFEEVKKEHRQNKKTIVVEQMGEQTLYAPITLPVRADVRSAGYDIYLPLDVTLLPGRKTLIWTDIKAYMQEDEVLEIYPRSSLGIKQGIMFGNTVGIIDSSYYGNEGNDGNIGLSLLNTSGVGVELKAGDRIAQGIFKKYLKTDNDTTLSDTRTGGMGSSGK
jgi:dUTP pyrophosphatase